MRSSAHLTVFGVALASIALVGVACGGATERSSERFCGELAAHANEIRIAPESADQIPALITLFSKMGEVAPLDVQQDWEQVYGSLKTADSVNVNDPASVQAVADAAFATQRSAENVVTWASDNCGIDLGPVGAVSGGATVIVTTTTSVVASTTAG